MHLFDMPIDGSAPPRRISSEVVGWPLLLSNDETRAAALGTNDRVMLLSLEGEKSQTVPGCAGGDVPIGFTPDDSALWIFRRGRISVTIERVDIASGARAHRGTRFSPAIPPASSTSSPSTSPRTARPMPTVLGASCRICTSSPA